MFILIGLRGFLKFLLWKGGDRLYWLGVVLITGYIVGFLDLWIKIPVFEGTLIFYTLGTTLILFVIYYISDLNERKKVKQIERDLPGFEKARIYQIKKWVAEDPGFKTLCHQCNHFSPRISGCTLHLFNRKIHVKLAASSQVTYCLYWNLEDWQHLMQAREWRPFR